MSRLHFCIGGTNDRVPAMVKKGNPPAVAADDEEKEVRDEQEHAR